MFRRTNGTAVPLTFATFLPKRSTWPLVAGSAQKTILRSVDFPAPDGPVRKTNSPLSISSVTSVSAGGSPGYSLWTWKSWIIRSSGRTQLLPLAQVLGEVGEDHLVEALLADEILPEERLRTVVAQLGRR